MSQFNRATLIKVHMLLAAFMFPVALMFLVTGALYTWGIKGSYVSDAQIIPLQEPLAKDVASLEAMVATELSKRGISLPSGSPSLKTSGTSFQLEWTGSTRDVVLEPTADALAAKLTIKDTTWYRRLVQLHKAKGGQLFKVYAAMLAAALFTILLTGFTIAWQVPKYRRLALVFSGAGVLMFVLMMSAS